MFLCEDCRTAKGYPDSGIVRVCTCEVCGNQTTCTDCPSGVPIPSGLRFKAEEEEKRDELEKKFVSLVESHKKLEAELICDVCLGDPKSVQGECACKGSGKITGVVDTLREAMVDLSRTCGSLMTAIESIATTPGAPAEVIAEANGAMKVGEKTKAIWSSYAPNSPANAPDGE